MRLSPEAKGRKERAGSRIPREGLGVRHGESGRTEGAAGKPARGRCFPVRVRWRYGGGRGERRVVTPGRLPEVHGGDGLPDSVKPGRG